MTAHYRASERIDYQPDVCKDYKETGYCGYGDNCKFVHDRGDYKSGWELEKEWEEQQKLKKEREKQAVAEFEADDFKSLKEEDKKPDDDLPVACTICREDFKDPVKTQCGHYFCEKCALDYNKKTKKCFNCDEPTNGLFQAAHELRAKLKKLKK